MGIYYAKSTNGFYVSDVHGDAMPGDAKEVIDSEYLRLIELQADGCKIVPDDAGNPIAVECEKHDSPSVCTPAQGLIALFALKQITEDYVLEAVAQIPDPVQQYTARIGYQRATTWERNSPAMAVMATLLQLSDDDLDELFSFAVTVQV